MLFITQSIVTPLPIHLNVVSHVRCTCIHQLFFYTWWRFVSPCTAACAAVRTTGIHHYRAFFPAFARFTQLHEDFIRTLHFCIVFFPFYKINVHGMPHAHSHSHRCARTFFTHSSKYIMNFFRFSFFCSWFFSVCVWFSFSFMFSLFLLLFLLALSFHLFFALLCFPVIHLHVIHTNIHKLLCVYFTFFLLFLVNVLNICTITFIVVGGFGRPVKSYIWLVELILWTCSAWITSAVLTPPDPE